MTPRVGEAGGPSNREERTRFVVALHVPGPFHFRGLLMFVIAGRLLHTTT